MKTCYSNRKTTDVVDLDYIIEAVGNTNSITKSDFIVATFRRSIICNW